MNNQLATLQKQAMQRLPNFARHLPRHVDAEHFAQSLLACVQRSPQLLDADRSKLWQAAYDVASMGLDLTPGAKECFILPFRDRGATIPTVVPHYQGLLKLALAHPDVIAINADAVCDNDTFDHYTDETGPRLMHRRPPFSDARGEIVGAYAVATLAGGGTVIATLSRTELDGIRARAPSKNSPAWRGDFAEMAKKTAIKRLCKLLPRTTQLQRAIAADNRHERPDLAHPRAASIDLALAIIDEPEQIADATTAAAATDKQGKTR